MQPTDLSRCNDIPKLRRRMSEWDQRFSDLEHRPFSDSAIQADRNRLNALRRERTEILDLLFGENRPKDPEKLDRLESRRADIQSEINKL